MKKKIFIILLLLVSVVLIGCGESTTNKTTNKPTIPVQTTKEITTIKEVTTTKPTTRITTIPTTVISTTTEEIVTRITFPDEILNYRNSKLNSIPTQMKLELQKDFKFFWEKANKDKSSSGYGLIPDYYDVINRRSGACSIASVGFGLSMIPVGVEYGWITEEEGRERVYGTLNTIWNLKNIHGFYYHFLNMITGARDGNCEVSIIDTALMICGILTAGKYFGGEIYDLACDIYERVEWNWYYNESTYRFYMGYNPDSKKFAGAWDYMAEQLMIYFLAAGSPTYPVDAKAYKRMCITTIPKKVEKTSEYDAFYPTWIGSMFAYQFSHAWVDFRNIIDENGINWFDNSVNATKASISYAKQLSAEWEAINEKSYGNSATLGPNGYKGSYGIRPCISNGNLVDGTMVIHGSLASIVFTPNEAKEAAKYLYNVPNLWDSDWGFIDSYNLGTLTDDYEWYCPNIYGLNKGITGLMIENYVSNMIWNIFMSIPYVQTGLTELGFSEV